jgi:mono/diheme cytochrome c family protein
MQQRRIVIVEDSMLRPHVLALGLAFAFACVASASALAQISGPMSSGYKPNTAQAQPPTGAAPPANAKDEKGQLDVNKLFAGTCGWCHSNGGRTAGKGPKLAGTTLTDAEIANRIKNGKAGAMPAFGSTFSDDDIKAIIKYIRDLKET